jgi:membrane protease YdiL (CAAX protease family)
MFRSEEQIWSHGLHMLVHGPLYEELLYRVALCVPLVALVGPRWTILASGLVFAALHVRYGNPAADNCIAGFVLGWAYLRSSCLLVPLLLHALGNLCAFLVHVAIFYYLT